MAEQSIVRRFFGGVGRVFSAARNFTANLLFLLFLVMAFALLFGGPGRITVPDGVALVVAPEGSVVEQTAQFAPFESLFGTPEVDAETAFRDLAEAISGAKDDDRIRLIVLDLDYLTGVSPAHLEALGAALGAARAAGKEIIAVGDYYSQAQFYLASYANAVYMHPMGQVLLQGFAAYQMYFKDALAKLKVNVHVFRVGTYKEAVEPFIRSDMSPEAREANRALVTELWGRYTQTVASNRKLDAPTIQQYVDGFPGLLESAKGDMARVALEQGLVDELLTRDEMRARLIARVGEADGNFRQIGHRDYVAALRQHLLPSGKPEVGVVVAAGVIQMGEQPRGRIGADTLTELIRQARLDDNVRALVLRVDSPGGGALASELIRQELELFQVAGKPLVVSMAGAAASGGYWISATADEIWAAPTTITGSIGIFGIMPTFEETLSAIGVSRDGVGSTTLAGAMDPLGAMSEPVQRIVQANVENGYTRFLNLVARGRDMLPEDVDRVGQGRVWSGQQALKLGLVDGIGHLDDAVAAAAKRAGIDAYTVRYLEKPLSTRDQLLAQIAENLGLAQPRAWSAVQRSVEEVLSLASALDDPAHVYGLCSACTLMLR